MDATPTMSEEITVLRHRLEEAEALIQAIQRGEVDALVVNTPAGAATYTLTGADRPYRVFLDTMHEGALTTDAMGTVLYANRALAALAGVPLESILGTDVRQLFAAQADAQWGQPGLQDRELLTADGRRVHVAVSTQHVEFEGAAIIAALVRDMSEHLLTQRLSESEERLRLAAEATGFGVYDVAPLANRAVWSTQLKRIVAMPEDGPDDPDLLVRRLHPEDRERFLEARSRTTEIGPSTHELEFRIIRDDGEVRWLRDTAHRFVEMVGGQPRVVRVLGTVRDITERKRAEETLRANEEKLRLFIEHAPAGVAMFDRDMRYIACSRRWAHDYRIPDDVFGRAHYELFPDLPDRWKDVHRRGLSGETLCAEDDAFARADGTTQYVTWEVRPWRRSSGEVGGILIGAEDVTHRVEAEQRLRDSETTFRVMFNVSSMGKAQADAVGRFLRVNQAFCRMTGFDESELLTRTFADVTHPDDRQADAMGFRRMIDGTSDTYVTEKRYVRKDGSIIWAQVTGNAIRDERGQLVRTTAVVQDITDRKRADEAMVAQHRRLNLLARTAQRLLVSDEPPRALLETICADVAQLIDMEIFFHYRLSDHPGELVLAAHGGTTPEEERRFATMRFGELLCGRVAQRRERLVVEDLQHVAIEGAEVLRGVGATSYAGFPLLAHGELLGTIAFISRRRTHLRDGDVQLIQTICDQMAVTLERARLESELRTSEANARLALDGADMGSWDVDLRSGATTWSRRHAEAQGYTTEDAPATVERWEAHVHPDDLMRVREAMARACASREPFGVEHRVFRADTGEERWLALYGRYDYDEVGEPLRVSGVSLDVTDRKRADTSLRESETRFRLMADQTPIIMWVTDPTGGIEFVNAAYSHFFGVTLAQVGGQSWRPLVHPEDAAYVQAFSDALRTRSAFHASCRVRRADGEWRWIDSTGQPRFTEDGEFLGLIGVSPDITDQRRAAELEREAARQKDEFIAVLAHELRNPLAPIRTSVGVLRAPGTKESTLIKCRDIIDRQVAHMARLLDDLLDVSRLSRGMLTLQPTIVRLRDVVEDALETVRPIVDDRGHTLTVNDIDPSLVLEADAARLAQVLTNLLNNAAKYTPPPGAISVHVEVQDQAVVLRVRDNGIGLRHDMRERIFELFTQMEDARQHADGGLGIGLGLTKRLVEMHGGTITAESQGPQQGATFTVTLPLQAGKPAPATSGTPWTSPSTQPPARRRVLIVDDNVDAADTLAMLLETLGCEVRTVYDGQSALQEAHAFQPDLVLLDLGMPDIDGQAVCRRLRAETWGTNIVIAAVTGWGQDEDRRRTRVAGFDHHLVKPVDPEVLQRLVRELPEERVM